MALTPTQIAARITEIDRQLAAGVQSTAVNGISISRNLQVLQEERRHLERSLDRARRPRCASINLSRF